MKQESSGALSQQTDDEQSHIQTGLFRRPNGHGHTFTDRPKPPPRKPDRRPARVARLLAFAHKIQKSIDDGEYRGLADAAKRLGHSPARMTQIMKLLVLAPDIQEEMLFMERVDGVEPISERTIRRIARFEGWGEQRRVRGTETRSPTEKSGRSKRQ